MLLVGLSHPWLYLKPKTLIQAGYHKTRQLTGDSQQVTAVGLQTVMVLSGCGQYLSLNRVGSLETSHDYLLQTATQAI
jgi:hypothetical protein